MVPEHADPTRIEAVEPADAVSLLADNGLPTIDLQGHPALELFGMRDDGALVAVAGLECHDGAALLRSVAVAPDHRGRGLGSTLTAFAEGRAVEHGCRSIYLLTETADRFFRARGYTPIARTEAPECIRSTVQFTQLCPAAARLLAKAL